MFLLVVQLLLPLLMLASVAVGSRSRALKLCQVGATFFYLLAVHLAGLWLELPWWTPWLLWALYAGALVKGWRSAEPGWRPQGMGVLASAAWVLTGAATAWLCATALLARIPPRGPAVDLTSPLAPGRYVVVNGGNRSLTNGHFETLHPTTTRQAAYRGQSYALDIVGLTPFGRMSAEWSPRDPTRYAIFGTPILAPCTGQVIARLDGRRDMPVPQMDTAVMAGNHVVLRCGEVHLLLAHMRRGSVAVQAGETVSTGQKLGEVGNSGSTTAPHLHLHAQTPGRPTLPFAGDPLPIRVSGRYLVRGDRL